MDGIINVYKEAGFTSFDVVAKLRGILKQKKIGHTGTLDPDAEGVLPVCIGKATKICEYLTEKDKAYQAVLRLGITTDTQDMSGTVLSERRVALTEEEIPELLRQFTGKQKQIPPMYSALKVNGRKLCDLARNGIEVERKAREIEIFSIKALHVQMPRITLQVHCSKGTYIRTLCQDIGERAGCGGCMERLLRTKTGGFLLEHTYRLGEIEAIAHGEDPKGRLLSDILIPVDWALKEYPRADALPGTEKLLQNGGILAAQKTRQRKGFAEGRLYRLYNAAGVFTGLFCYDAKGDALKPKKMFLQQCSQEE